MRQRMFVAATVAGLSAAPFAVSAFWSAEPPPGQPDPAQMAEMMAKAAKYTQPGEHHKVLSRFVGKWDMEARMVMGGRSTPPERIAAETSWLMEGRWLKWEARGTFMGMPFHSVALLGYDNFKQSYVMTSVSNLDTAMFRAEGDMDPGGKTLILYGTLDEYLTGEHDKMVKYVYRFESDDKIVLEVHDLPIGEKNTKVLEFTSTRRKS